MQPNLWPSMNGGGVEQVGATQAVNDLLIQNVGGVINFFPGFEPGQPISFKRIRTIGAFVVSASRSADSLVSDVLITSEKGGNCSFAAPLGMQPLVTTLNDSE